MKISILRRYSSEFGGNRISAFYGFHRFEFGGKVIKSIHLWPFCVSISSTLS